MTPIDEFEQAIVKFGVKAALEYFATPESEHHLWNDVWEREIVSKQLQNTSSNSDYAKSCKNCKHLSFTECPAHGDRRPWGWNPDEDYCFKSPYVKNCRTCEHNYYEDNNYSCSEKQIDLTHSTIVENCEFYTRKQNTDNKQ